VVRVDLINGRRLWLLEVVADDNRWLRGTNSRGRSVLLNRERVKQVEPNWPPGTVTLPPAEAALAALGFGRGPWRVWVELGAGYGRTASREAGACTALGFGRGSLRVEPLLLAVCWPWAVAESESA
jgi:hypothetical protein